MTSGTGNESAMRMQETDYLLGSPAAGRFVAVALVAGIAVGVGIALTSLVAAVVTAVVGAVTAYATAHDDDWALRRHRRRARRRHVAVEPRWADRSWSAQSWGSGSVGRHAA
ncbi:hypothetical protein [Prescottella subtropica]|uniref:hypothetical protein n=1 Tax=Prescottella subtropica TaxID=2545757 RepID=UPI0010F70473|nr:hypothetical protein [Prescottella subtropica]